MGLRQWATEKLRSIKLGFAVKRYSSYTSQIGGLANYGNNDSKTHVDRYLTLDDVYSIIKFRARTTAAMPIRVYKVKNEAKLKEYKSFISVKEPFTKKRFAKAIKLKEQSLEEVDNNNELQQLLDNPNPSYSGFEFKEGIYTFLMLTGNTYINTAAPELGVNAGVPKELHLMPSPYTHPIIAGSFPKFITGYELNLGGVLKFPVESVMHLRYFNPEFTEDGGQLIGMSPLTALNRTAVRGQSENEYMVKGFQNAGAQGIVNFEELEADDPTIEKLGKLKSDYYRESTGTRNAQKNIFMPGKTSFTAVGLGPVEMKVIESQKITFKKFCNALFVSDILFNSDAASTESNVKEATTRMYTNACLPDGYALTALLNQKLTPKFNKNGVNYFIDIDITGISELQEDMKAMMEAYASAPMFNAKLIAESQGMPYDPSMDRWYIKTGYTPIEDLDVPDLPEDDKEPIKE